MINLQSNIDTLRKIVRETLLEFEKNHNEIIWYTFAFDSAPIYGSVYLNFDTEKKSNEILDKYQHNGPAWQGEDKEGKYNNNCADFEYSGVNKLHFPEWEDEYNDYIDIVNYIDVDGVHNRFNHIETGDEGYNIMIFRLLTTVRDLEKDW